MSILMLRGDLLEYCVHCPGRQQNLSIRYGHGRAISNRSIEGLDKVLPTGIHMEVHCEKKTGVMEKVCQILLGKTYRWDEVFCVTLKVVTSKSDENPLVLIERPCLVKDPVYCNCSNHLAAKRYRHANKADFLL